MRDNRKIPYFQELANERGVLIKRVGKYQTKMVIDCGSCPIIDIAFTQKPRGFLDGLLLRPTRFEIAEKIYCYGRGATTLRNVLSADTALHEQLQLLFDRFRSPIEWHGDKLLTFQSVAVAESDETAGRRFLDAFVSVKERLDLIDASRVMGRTGDGVGPAGYRRWIPVISYAFAAVLFLVGIAAHVRWR
jgi:hypothetical protein